jgi:polyisoprenoid-binding protein YceI
MTTAPVTDLAVGTYTVDPAHSRVGFAVRHLGFSKVRGHFPSFTGSLELDPSDLSTLRATATIDATSITTADEKRDEHLRSEDFFDVTEHPTLSFSALEARDAAGDSVTLVGDLTMRGVTRTVELDAVYLGEATDPWGGTRVAFEGQTTVNRKDFGLNWNAVLETGGFLVGEDVEITLEIQAVRS